MRTVVRFWTYRFTLAFGPALIAAVLLACQCLAAPPPELQQGVELYEAGQYESAIASFQRAAAADPQWAAKAHYRVGLCYTKLKRHDYAIPSFLEAFRVNEPVDSKLTVNLTLALADSYASTGALDKAIPLIREIALTQPQKACYLIVHGCAAARQYEQGAAAAIYGLVSIPGVEHSGSEGLPEWLLEPSAATVGDYVKDAAPKIANNTIIRNDDGGIYCSSLPDDATLEITNNTIADNSLLYDGTCGGIYLTSANQSARVLISNCIVASNAGNGIEAYWTYAGSCALRCNDVWDHTENYAGTKDPTHRYGNISTDPEFVAPLSGNYSLETSSPCKDKGASCYVWWDGDKDCEYRVQDGEVDMGADEVAGCRYSLTLALDNECVATGDSPVISANVYDPVTGQVVIGQHVDFSVDGGQVTPNDGTTDANGNVEAEVTRTTEGPAKFSATLPTCGDYAPQSVTIRFLDADRWPMFHRDIYHTGVTTTSLGTNLEVKWYVPLAGDHGGVLWSSPVVEDGWVYVGTNNADGTLYAISTDGQTVRSVNLRQSGQNPPPAPIHGTPCVADGKVYVGTWDGRLHVRDAETLAADWTFTCMHDQTVESITGSPTVYDGAAYIGAFYGYDGWLHTVDLDTHTERCSVADDRETWWKIDFSAPAIDPDFVSFVCDKAYPYTGPAPTPRRCYVSDKSCWVAAFGVDDGASRWEESDDEQAMYPSPMCYRGHFFVGSNAKGMYRYTDSGGEYWLDLAYFDGAGNDINSTAAGWNGYIYFGTEGNKVCKIDASDFQTDEWTSADLGAPVSSSPLISTPTGILFGATRNGYLFALSTINTGTINGGDEVWHFDLRDDGNWANAKVLSSPSAASGRLYIVAGDANGRRLYCFGPP